MPIPSFASSLQRVPLRNEVFYRLRTALVDGSFAPGEQLRDGELADWLGVSRTPAREALLRLAGAGLVESRPGRSTTVTALDHRAARDACEVVAARHQLAVRESVAKLAPADLAAMTRANKRFSTAVRASDLNALSADDDLPAVPVAVAANAAVAAVLDQYTPMLRRAERLRFATLGGRASVDRHTTLIGLCAQGRAEAAAAVAFDTWHTLPTDRPDTQE
ncbi:GntR family transcriptional regulator [uncultured Jatrophihabitans sp.]|uniref:GntR family transcriptional regulator n=1 Tax=uncultured Jatrophihabitans sp. TaxID=1610747 RepID=UPI0035C98013